MFSKNVLRAVSALILTLVMALSLTACKTNSEPEATAKPEDVTGVPIVTVEPATATPVVTEEPVPTEAPTEAPTKAPAASGTNVALDADVEVSSTTGETHVQWGWSYEYINDGVIIDTGLPSVGWTTAVKENFDDQEQEEWVLFTLAQDTSINKIIVYPVGRFPESFKLMVSSDGKEFTTVAEVNDNTRFADNDTEPYEFEFEAVNCRYVQFLATRLCDPSPADGYLCQVAEIEIFAA